MDLKDIIIELSLKNKELEEYKKNCTRKHWQKQCGENYLRWKYADIALKKAIKFIKEQLNEEGGLENSAVNKLLYIIKSGDSENWNI